MKDRTYVGMTLEEFMQGDRIFNEVHYQISLHNEPLIFGWVSRDEDDFKKFFEIFPQYTGACDLILTCPKGHSIVLKTDNEESGGLVWGKPFYKLQVDVNAIERFSSCLPNLPFTAQYFCKFGLDAWLERCDWQLMNNGYHSVKYMLDDELGKFARTMKLDMCEKNLAMKMLARLPFLYRTYYPWSRDDDVIELLLQHDLGDIEFHAENRITVAYKRWLINPQYEKAFGQPLLRKLNGLSIGDYMRRTTLKKSLQKDLPKVKGTKQPVRKI